MKTGVGAVQHVSTGQYRRHEQRWGTLSNNHQASAGWDKPAPLPVCYRTLAYIINTLFHSLKLRIWSCALEPDHKVTLDHRFSTIRSNSLQYRGLWRSFMSPRLYLQVHLSIQVPVSVLFSRTKRFPWTLSDWPRLLKVSGSSEDGGAATCVSQAEPCRQEGGGCCGPEGSPVASLKPGWACRRQQLQHSQLSPQLQFVAMH